MRFRLLVFAFVFMYCNSLFSQNILTSRQLHQLDSIAAQDVPKGAPGIATAIIENGKTIYEKYDGFADFADSSLITKQTRFNLASNAKQFTALAILTLIDNKKINLTDDIRKFLPNLYPSIKSKISIANLLNHTSGIRDVYDLWALEGLTWWQQSFNNSDVLALVKKQQDLNFPPNTQHLYSNTNYILLSLIIEQITGQSFVEFTNTMFKKLNMPNTSFEANHIKIRGPVARAYFNFDTWKTYNWIWDVCGDGNLFSTMEDQIQWEKIVQGKVATLIKKEIIEKSQRLINGFANIRYGYGLEFGKYKGIDYSFHEGATGAWKATVIRFAGKNISMITLTNTGKSMSSMQTRQMADVVLKLEKDAAYLTTKPRKIGSYIPEQDLLGIYSTGEAFTFQFDKVDGRLYLKRLGRNDIELEREADNIFHQKSDRAFKQEFTINTKGEMEVTAYYTTHAPYTLRRINSSWDEVNYQALNGKYLNAETNTFIYISFINSKSYNIKIGTQDSTKALLLTPEKLLVDNYTIDIKNKRTPADILFLNGDRIRRIRFVRVQ